MGGGVGIVGGGMGDSERKSEHKIPRERGRRRDEVTLGTASEGTANEGVANKGAASTHHPPSYLRGSSTCSVKWVWEGKGRAPYNKKYMRDISHSGAGTASGDGGNFRRCQGRDREKKHMAEKVSRPRYATFMCSGDRLSVQYRKHRFCETS